ncbi:hypothetical protein BDV96DRAFT_598306 [Lophiotrema nucula]|uniref:Uncharacterized protein n=1 Tax=Lophiotrema nucula TaxID=690887 RepID=A0A6A5ZD81_9PLEO|nr:hypothetical protein BDV96DRAFT_598306 [Lophiotrema nucula]
MSFNSPSDVLDQKAASMGGSSQHCSVIERCFTPQSSRMDQQSSSWHRMLRVFSLFQPASLHKLHRATAPKAFLYSTFANIPLALVTTHSTTISVHYTATHRSHRQNTNAFACCKLAPALSLCFIFTSSSQTTTMFSTTSSVFISQNGASKPLRSQVPMDKILRMTASGRISTKFTANTGKRIMLCKARPERVRKSSSISGAKFEPFQSLYDRISKAPIEKKARRIMCSAKVVPISRRAVDVRKRRYRERATGRLMKKINNFEPIFFNIFQQKEVEGAKMDRKTRKHIDMYIQSPRTILLNEFGRLWDKVLGAIDRLATNLYGFTNGTPDSKASSDRFPFQRRRVKTFNEVLGLLQPMWVIMKELVGLMPSELNDRDWKTRKLAQLCHTLKLCSQHPTARELNILTSEILNCMLTPPVSIESEEELRVADLREIMRTMRSGFNSWQNQGSFGDPSAIQDATKKILHYCEVVKSFSEDYPRQNLAWYWNLSEMRAWGRWMKSIAQTPEQLNLLKQFGHCFKAVLDSRDDHDKRRQKIAHNVFAKSIPLLNQEVCFQVCEEAGDDDKLDSIEGHVEIIYDHLKHLEDTKQKLSGDVTKDLLLKVNADNLEQLDHYLAYRGDDDSWNMPMLRENGKLAEMYASKSKYNQLRVMTQYLLDAIREATKVTKNQPPSPNPPTSPTLSLRDGLQALFGLDLHMVSKRHKIRNTLMLIATAPLRTSRARTLRETKRSEFQSLQRDTEKKEKKKNWESGEIDKTISAKLYKRYANQAKHNVTRAFNRRGPYTSANSASKNQLLIRTIKLILYLGGSVLSQFYIEKRELTDERLQETQNA